MAACKGCAKEIRWMDTFPGDICVDCHRAKSSGASAEEDYKAIMTGFGNPERVAKVQELRRSNAAGPRKSKKSYKRKPKYPEAQE
jgi:hypothetical protein